MTVAATTNMQVRRLTYLALLTRTGGRISRAVWLVAFCIVLLAAGAVGYWMATGDRQPLIGLLDWHGSFVLVALAAFECGMALICWRQYERGEPLRYAWLCISLGSGFKLAGLAFANSISNLAFDGWQSGRSADAARIASIKEFSLGALNPVTIALLIVGLLIVLRAYLDVGLLRAPRWPGMILLLIVGGFVVSQWIAIARWALNLTRPVGGMQVLNWLTGSLLGVLLLEAVLLYSAIAEMGDALVASCWGAYSVAIFLASFADLGVWALGNGIMPWSYANVNSIVWLLAGLAFTLGPAYQLEIVVRARRLMASSSRG